MRIISRRTLREFWQKPAHRDARQPLAAWFKEAQKAAWRTPHNVKRTYATASILGNDRVVFNVGGNKYRLVVSIRYDLGIVLIRFVGTHAEYNGIDAEKV